MNEKNNAHNAEILLANGRAFLRNALRDTGGHTLLQTDEETGLRAANRANNKRSPLAQPAFRCMRAYALGPPLRMPNFALYSTFSIRPNGLHGPHVGELANCNFSI